jgi:hypothetical protein
LNEEAKEDKEIDEKLDEKNQLRRKEKKITEERRI